MATTMSTTTTAAARPPATPAARALRLWRAALDALAAAAERVQALHRALGAMPDDAPLAHLAAEARRELAADVAAIGWQLNIAEDLLDGPWRPSELAKGKPRLSH